MMHLEGGCCGGQLVSFGALLRGAASVIGALSHEMGVSYISWGRKILSSGIQPHEPEAFLFSWGRKIQVPREIVPR